MYPCNVVHLFQWSLLRVFIQFVEWVIVRLYPCNEVHLFRWSLLRIFILLNE